MKKQLFRKVALERLSSPEQLDQLLTVTTPRGWVALIGLGCLLIGVILWSIFGTISTQVNGQGVLIKGGGISDVIALSEGQIADIRVVAGDHVHKGEVIARMDHTEITEQICDMEFDLQEIKNGIVNGNADKLEREIDHLKERLEIDSRVVSSYEGRVLEVKVQKGDFIDLGSPVVSLELEGDTVKNLEAVVYIPLEEGKKILPGMDVQIAPTIVKKEEYGFMMGRVVSVSKYPVTYREMMRVLGKDELVQMLLGKGAPIEVRVDLIPDEGMLSGYKWSSKEGPDMKMTSGTLCASSIIVKKERPIQMIIPFR